MGIHIYKSTESYVREQVVKLYETFDPYLIQYRQKAFLCKLKINSDFQKFLTYFFDFYELDLSI